MIRILIMLALFLVMLLSKAQPGSLDESFNSQDAGFSTGQGPSAEVKTIVLQPDGKILIGGDFNYYNGVSRNYIARLNADGTLDNSFDPGIGANGFIQSIALQSDGKIIIGGIFTSYNGAAKNRIARLNSNGSIDNTFNTDVNSPITTIGVQADGKIIIGGFFTSVDGSTANRIARLNDDGSLDGTFTTGTGANSNIESMTIQPDGRIVIGGSFTSYNGTARNRIARLNASGLLDISFNPGTGANNIVQFLALQPDARILVGGSFSTFNGTSRPIIVRLNTDGSIDNTFNTGTGPSGTVRTILIQPDNRIVIAGAFTSFNGQEANRIARINTNGSFDPGFNSVQGANYLISCSALQPDGKVLIGGQFGKYNETFASRRARLNVDGSLDTSFIRDSPSGGCDNAVYSISIQQDQKIILGGAFNIYNESLRNGIARLNQNGTIDQSFTVGSGFSNWVYATAIQTDGKIVVGGVFQNYNGNNSQGISRINADGSYDASFTSGLLPVISTVRTTLLQPDGRIVIGGSFPQYSGTSRNNIVRLNSDGSLDTSFDPGTGANSEVYALARQTDGKIILGGAFTAYAGTPVNRLVRINPNGTIDNTFNIGTGADGIVYAIAIEPDGKILVAGAFTTFNGVTKNRIVRLMPNGATDASFDVGTGLNGPAYTLLRLATGKIIVAGLFTNYNGVARGSIARLNADGSNDLLFDPGTGAQAGFVWTIQLQNQSALVMGGNFLSYNGVGRNRLALVQLEPPPGEPEDIEVYNVVTTNPNGKHDFLNIRNITLFPNNRVTIYDRWGNQVYEKESYDNVTNPFTGKSDSGKDLPDGTYYYVIDKNNGSDRITGFLLLRR